MKLFRKRKKECDHDWHVVKHRFSEDVLRDYMKTHTNGRIQIEYVKAMGNWRMSQWLVDRVCLKCEETDLQIQEFKNKLSNLTEYQLDTHKREQEAEKRRVEREKRRHSKAESILRRKGYNEIL